MTKFNTINDLKAKIPPHWEEELPQPEKGIFEKAQLTLYLVVRHCAPSPEIRRKAGAPALPLGFHSTPCWDPGQCAEALSSKTEEVTLSLFADDMMVTHKVLGYGSCATFF